MIIMERYLRFIVVLLFLVVVGVGSADGGTMVRLETNYGDIDIELYDDLAPETVANFLGYVDAGFYDGLIFHRVIEDFMIQAGAYNSNLYDADFEDPNNFDPQDPNYYREPGDPIDLEVDADLENVRGTISMAHTTDPDSATSQFFINVEDNPYLDPGTSPVHAVFGEVISGMQEVADVISEVETEEVNSSFEDMPVEPVIIEKAFVFTDQMQELKISFKAGNLRQTGSDKFYVKGEFGDSGPTAANFEGEYVTIRLGPWQTSIDTNDDLFKWKSGEPVSYRGFPDPENEDMYVKLNLNLAKGTFKILAKDVNLTGLTRATLEFVVGDYHGAGTAQVRGNREVPMKFMSSYQDSLRGDRYVYTYYDGGNYTDSISVKGEIASEAGSIDLVGKNKKMTVHWGSKTFTTTSFEQVGRKEKYTYSRSWSSFRKAVFDWTKCTFKVVMKQSGIGGPSKDLRIVIEDTDLDEVLFDEAVTVE